MLYLPSFKNENNVDFFTEKDLLNANLDEFLEGIGDLATKDTNRSFLKETISGELMQRFNETTVLDSAEMCTEYVYESLKHGNILQEA